MFLSNSIRLFWWNEKKLQGKSKENYGDLLGKYLVEKISGKSPVWVKPKAFSLYNYFTPIYVTIGSILTNVTKHCIVWGSGIISKEYPIEKAEFLAVRGPQTRKHLMAQGYEVPEVYGDPALLLPSYYQPKITKQYKIGVVPHYKDYNTIKDQLKNNESILLIDLMTDSIEATTDQFLKCEAIVSSSLHGVIVAHAYQIPAVWQKFSNDVAGDDIKYQDYFESVNIKAYKSEIISEPLSLELLTRLLEVNQKLPKNEVIYDLREGLMQACPFKNQMN